MITLFRKTAPIKEVVPVKMHTCSTLLLSDYINCQVDGRLDVLAIEGEASNEEKLQTWQRINEEYYDMSENKQAAYELTLVAEMEALNYKIIAIQEAVDILKVYRNADLVELLHKLGFRFPFNHKDIEQYNKDLKRVLSRAKTFVVEHNAKQAEIDKIGQTRKDNAPIDRAYYDKILSILSKFNGYGIDEKSITVSRYISILNVYISHCEQLNTKRNARG